MEGGLHSVPLQIVVSVSVIVVISVCWGDVVESTIGTEVSVVSCSSSAFFSVVSLIEDTVVSISPSVDIELEIGKVDVSVLSNICGVVISSSTSGASGSI